MKKVLLIILLGFIVVSIITIMFTIQESNTFTNFEEDNSDNGDDCIRMSYLDNDNIKNKLKIFPEDLVDYSFWNYFKVSNFIMIHICIIIITNVII